MMERTKTKKRFNLFLIWSLLLLSPFMASAQYSVERLTDAGQFNDFVVGPGKKEITLNPGQSAIADILVTNRMGEKRTFFLETEDFRGSENVEQTIVLLGDERGPYSLKDYLSVPFYEFSLEHGERATIPVTISIPPDAEPGGKYGSLVISTVSNEAEKTENTASTALISRIGTLFFVTVPGEIEKSGSLEDFKTNTGRKFFGGGPIDFEILFRNTGSVYLNPYGEIRISNFLGKEIDAIKLDAWFALPDSLRLREITWDRDWLLGVYTAHAFINRGYEDIVDEKSFTFFVIPWKLALILLLSIFILILILRFIFKRFEFKRKV